MTPQEIFDQVRYLTKTTSSDGFSNDTDLLRMLNDYYRRQCTTLVALEEDKFGVKSTTTTDLVANQESYQLPTDLMRIKRVEITYDGTNWYKVRIQDSGEVQDFALDPTHIANEYTQNQPYADLFGEYLSLRPVPPNSQTNGLKLWYIQLPGLLSNSSSAVLTPTEYHGYLAYGVASEVARRKLDMTFSAEMVKMWELGIQEMETKFAPRAQDYQMNMLPYSVRYT